MNSTVGSSSGPWPCISPVSRCGSGGTSVLVVVAAAVVVVDCADASTLPSGTAGAVVVDVVVVVNSGRSGATIFTAR